jgi:hypothetical protein
MTFPPRKPKFSIPVSGARLGSVARPTTDQPVVAAPGLPRPRFGLRTHASTLRVGPVVDEPSGPIIETDGEVA